MKILSLDMSSVSTGFSVYDTYTHQFRDVGLLSYRNTEVYSQLGPDLTSLCVQHQPDIIIAEDCFYSRNAETFKVLCRLQGILLQTASNGELNGLSRVLPVYFLMPSAWRRMCSEVYDKKMNYKTTAECKVASLELANTVLAGRSQVLSNDVSDAVCLALAWAFKDLNECPE
jgi:Holliday junction resolvasome RuvABC endonuclease subunit